MSGYIAARRYPTKQGQVEKGASVFSNAVSAPCVPGRLIILITQWLALDDMSLSLRRAYTFFGPCGRKSSLSNKAGFLAFITYKMK